MQYRLFSGFIDFLRDFLRCSDSSVEDYENNVWEGFDGNPFLGADYLEHFASHLGGGFKGYYPEMVGKFGNESEDSIAIVSKGIGWEETEMGGFSVDVIYNFQNRKGDKKAGVPATYKGWGVFYPKQYFVELGDKYLTK